MMGIVEGIPTSNLRIIGVKNRDVKELARLPEPDYSISRCGRGVGSKQLTQ